MLLGSLIVFALSRRTCELLTEGLSLELLVHVHSITEVPCYMKYLAVLVSNFTISISDGHTKTD
jgi:hypothetical protein